MERFFGGRPILIVLKLVIASLVIGVVLSFFGFNPNNLYHAIIRLGDWISSLGFDAVKRNSETKVEKGIRHQRDKLRISSCIQIFIW